MFISTLITIVQALPIVQPMFYEIRHILSNEGHTVIIYGQKIYEDIVFLH